MRAGARRVGTCGGFALLVAWLLVLCLGLGNGGVAHAPAILAALLLGAAVASAVVTAFAGTVRPLGRQRVLLWAAGCAGCVFTCGVAAGTAQEGLHWLGACSALLAGAMAALLLLAWQEFMATEGAASGLRTMACCVAAGAVLGCAASLLQGMAEVVVAGLLPIGAAVALRPPSGTRFFGNGTAPFDTGNGSALSVGRGLLTFMLRDYKVRFFVICAVVAGVFGASFAWAARWLETGWLLAVAGVLLVLAVLCARWVGSLPPRRLLLALYGVFGVLLVGAATLLAPGPVGCIAALAASGAGLMGVYQAIWSLMAAAAQGRRLPSLGLFSILLLWTCFGCAVGVAVGGVPFLSAAVLGVGCLVALGVAELLFASLNGRLPVAEEVFGETPATGPDQVLTYNADRWGLTAREAQVLKLWVAGHGAPYIEEALHISRNTVKTHVNHIYRKAGVTSREELRALLGQD